MSSCAPGSPEVTRRAPLSTYFSIISNIFSKLEEVKKKKIMNEHNEEVLMSLDLEVVDFNDASWTDDYSAVYSSIDEGDPDISSHCSVTGNSLTQQVLYSYTHDNLKGLSVPLIMTI